MSDRPAKAKMSIDTGLSDRVTWNGKTQARQQKYRRVIGLSKRCSIALGKTFPNAFPFVFVLGHPKSGTTWMCHLLADYLRLPFPQYSLFPLGCPAVLHSLEIPSRKYRTAVYTLRDGRDTVVSTYFHVRGRLLSGKATRHQQQLFDGLDPEADPKINLERFIERWIEAPAGGWSRLPDWGSHVGASLKAAEGTLQIVKYEDLLKDANATLATLVENLTQEQSDAERIAETVRRCSFQRQSGRKQGQENRGSYLRKGEAGDWRNHFTPSAAKLFDNHFGEVLIQANYEPDHSWVDEVGRE